MGNHNFSFQTSELLWSYLFASSLLYVCYRPGRHCAASTESDGAPKVLMIHVYQEISESCRPWMGES